MKTDKLTEIQCRLSDCLYYDSVGSQPHKALCSHHDAHRYVLSDPPCPLYRLDWQRKMAQAPPNFAPGPKKRFPF